MKLKYTIYLEFFWREMYGIFLFSFMFVRPIEMMFRFCFFFGNAGIGWPTNKNWFHVIYGVIIRQFWVWNFFCGLFYHLNYFVREIKIMAQHSYIVYQTLFHVIWFHRDRRAIEINMNHWNWLISRWNRWTIVVREKNRQNKNMNLALWIWCSMLYWKSIQVYDGHVQHY